MNFHAQFIKQGTNVHDFPTKLHVCFNGTDRVDLKYFWFFNRDNTPFKLKCFLV